MAKFESSSFSGKNRKVRWKQRPMSLGGEFVSKEENAALKRKVDKIKPTNLEKPGAMQKYRKDFEKKFGKDANK